MKQLAKRISAIILTVCILFSIPQEGLIFAQPTDFPDSETLQMTETQESDFESESVTLENLVTIPTEPSMELENDQEVSGESAELNDKEIQTETKLSEQTSGNEETTAAPETTVPEETTAAQETTAPEETTAAQETTSQEETTAAPETTVQEETTAAPETTVPEETTAAPETSSQEETTAAPETSSQEETTTVTETTTQEETTTEQETTTEEETTTAVNMPADILVAESPEMKVRIEYDEGIFPAGTGILVRQLIDTKYVEDAAQKAIGKDQKVVDVIAVDISFIDENFKKIQPTDPNGVYVTLTAKRAIDGENHTVIHMQDSGEADNVADASATGASFTSVGFSVYAVVGSDGKTGDEEEVRRTYIFYSSDNITEWARQIVKNGDILVEPGVPTLGDGQKDTYFEGWYAEGSETKMTFGMAINDIPTAENAVDQEVKVYPRYITRYSANFYDETGDIEHVKIGAPGTTITMDVEIPGLQEKFQTLLGWTKTKGSTAVEYETTATYTLNSDVDFYPVLGVIRKIEFNAEEDATFTAPVYVVPGKAIPAVAEPSRQGYTFKGWYTDPECTQLFDKLTDGTKVMPQGEGVLSLYAGWEGQDVNFEVYIWGEVMDESGNPYPDGNTNKYAVKAAWIDKAKAGHKFTVDEATEEYYDHIGNPEYLVDPSFDTNYYIIKSNIDELAASTVVKGDGSTIVNIYFDLKEFTLTFHNASGTDYYESYPNWRVNTIKGTAQTTFTFAAKLGQNINSLWPTFTYTLNGRNRSLYAVNGWRIATSEDNSISAYNQNTINATHRHTFTKKLIRQVNDVPQDTTHYYPCGPTSTDTVAYTVHYYYKLSEGSKETVDYNYNGSSYHELSEYMETIRSSYNANITPKDIDGYIYKASQSEGNTRRFFYERNSYNIVFHNYNHESTVTNIEYLSDISEYKTRVPNKEETGLPDYYEFQGWYTDRQHVIKYTFEGDQANMPAQTLTLYSYWKPKDITITFDAAGGTIGGQATTTQTIEAGNHAQDAGTPVREGYTFVGWGAQGQETDIVNFAQRRFTEDTTLVARWTNDANKFRVKYIDEFPDHAVPTDDNEYILGSQVVLRKSPSSNDSHMFHGWKIQGYDENTIYHPGDMVTVNDPAMINNGEITFAAYHGDAHQSDDLINVTITYHSNFPDGSAEKTYEEIGLKRNEQVQSKGADTFTCTGYEIVAWNTAADGSGTEFAPGDMIFADHNGDNDLYAIWQPADVQYTVEHYKQDLNDPNNYSIVSADTETKTAKTGTSVTAQPREYTGFTFDAVKTGTQNTGTVLANGSLVLKLYYSRNSEYTLTYKYIGTYPEGAALPTPNPVTGLKYEQQVTVATSPYVTGDIYNGYKFLGWHKEQDSLVFDGTTVTMPARNVVLDGTWEPVAVKYTVEVYEQNIDDNDYTKVQTDEKQAVTGTRVSETIDVPIGFIYNTERSENNKVVVGDGSTVLKLYFDRKTYKITYQYTNYSSLTAAGGAADPDAAALATKSDTYKFGADVEPTVDVTITTNPSNGYTFSGFSTNRYGSSFKMPDVEDLVFYGSFTHNDNASYIVEHYKHDLDAANNVLLDTYTEVTDDEEQKTGSAGAEAAYTQKDYTGYEFEKVEYVLRDGDTDTQASDNKIDGTGKTVVKVYYTPKKHTVNYTYTNGTPGSIPTPTQAVLDTDWDATYYYGATVSPKTETPSAPGYTFGGWKHSVSGSEATFTEAFTMPDRDVTIRGAWTAQTTSYKIEYWLQNVEGAEYTKDDTRTRTLNDHKTGDSVTASPAAITGFTYKAEASNASGTVAVDADGNPTLVLKLYYDRNVHKVTYLYRNYEAFTAAGGAADPDAEALAEIKQTYRFGADVKASDAAKVTITTNPYDGWSFGGWSTERYGEKFTMPDNDVVYYGTFSHDDHAEYVVEHWLHDVDAENNTLKETYTFQNDSIAHDGSAGEKATYQLHNYTGYTADKANIKYYKRPVGKEPGDISEDVELTGDDKDKILGDAGGYELVIYIPYEPQQYTVTYTYTNDTPGSTPNPTVEGLSELGGTYYYGAKVSPAAPATADGYTFGGWKHRVTETGGTGEQQDFTTPISMPARAVVISGTWIASNTTFSIEYYTEKLDGGYELDSKTENLTGTTGTTVNTATISGAEKEIKGFTLDKTIEGTVASALLRGDGTTTLKLYYTRNSYEINYFYRSTAPEGAPTIEQVRTQAGAPRKVKYGAEVITLGADFVVDVQGYPFVGWKADTDLDGNEEQINRGGSFTMPAGDVDIFGAYTHDLNVKYTVRHWLQNVGEDPAIAGNYTLDYTEPDSYGETEDIAHADPLSRYTNNGYEYNPTLTTHAEGQGPEDGSVKIVGEGTSVIDIYYKRKIFKVSYQYTQNVANQHPENPSVNDGNYEYGATVTLASDASAPGYTFSGWRTTYAGSSKTFTMPARDVVVSGSWTANQNTPYKVEAYREKLSYESEEDKYENTFNEERYAATNSLVTLEIDVPEGFVYNNEISVVKDTVDPQGNTVLRVYFDRKTYTITYQYTNYSSLTAAGGAADPDAAALSTKSDTYKFGAKVAPKVTVTIKQNPSNGYTFSGFSTNRYGSSFNMPDVEDIVFYGSFTHIDNASYIVEHYKHDLDAANNVLLDTYTEVTDDEEQKTGSAGAEAAYTQKDYTGYEFEKVEYVLRDGDKDNQASNKIDGTGKTVVKVYYTPKKHTVNYTYTNGTPGSIPTPTQAVLDADWDATYYYGATVSPKTETPLAPGYTFGGWKHSVSGSEATFTEAFTMPDRDVTIRGAWTAETTSYKIEYWLQNVDDNEYTKDDSRSRTMSDHKTGDSVTASPAAITGFTYKAEASNASGTVAVDEQGNPTLVLKLYYDRNEHKVTYQYRNYEAFTNAGGTATPTDTELAQITETYRYGASVKASDDAKVTITTNPYDGWAISEWTTDRYDKEFIMPDNDVVYYGTFTHDDHAEYVVEHWLHDVDAENNTLKETYTFQNDSIAHDGSAGEKATYQLHNYTGYTADKANIKYYKRPVGKEPGDISEDVELTGDDKDKILGDAGGYELVIYIPYEPQQYTVTYTYTNDTPGSTPNPTVEGLSELGGTYYYGAKVSPAAAATADGYTFGGWKHRVTETGGTGEQQDFTTPISMPARAVVISGTWTADPNKYTVWHWFEGTDGNFTNTYIKDGIAEECKGHEFASATGTTVTASVEDYEGYTFVKPGTSTVAPSKITDVVTGDGKMTLNLYYTRNGVFKLTYKFSGTYPTEVSVPAAVENLKYADEVTIDTTIKDAYGYTFNGWQTKHQGVEIKDGKIIMPDRDVEIIGTWSPKQTTYTIKHMVEPLTNEGEYELYGQAYTREGTTGTVGYAVPLTNTGFKVNSEKTRSAEENAGHTFTPESGDTVTRMEGIIKADVDNNGTTVFVYYYDRNEYEVKYVISGTIPEGIKVQDKDSGVYKTNNEKYGATVNVESDLSAPGYDFSGWTSTDVTPSGDEFTKQFTMPAKAVTFTGSFTPRKDTPYTVEYYWQNVGLIGYTLHEAETGKKDVTGITYNENLVGTTDSTVTAAQKAYEGFTLTQTDDTVASAKLRGDGETVLKLYYNRNKYDVIYHNTGKMPQRAPEIPSLLDVAFGFPVTTQPIPSADEFEDYIITSTAWETVEGSDLVFEKHEKGKLGFNMPARDVNLSVKWAEDFNHDNIDDDNQEFTVHYMKGEHGAFTEEAEGKSVFEGLKNGSHMPSYNGETDEYGKPLAETDWTFTAWQPVLTTVRAADCVEKTTDIYITAQWKEDKNNNDIPDEEETFTVIYLKGEHGTFTENTKEKTVFKRYAVGDETPSYAGETDDYEKPAGETDWTFAGWQPQVNPVIAVEDSQAPEEEGADWEIRYTATWKEDKNNNGIPDEDEIFVVIYTDGAEGTVFANERHEGLRLGDETPAFAGSTARQNYVFAGWNPQVAETVIAQDANAASEIKYEATWKDDKNNNGIPDEDEIFTVIYMDGDTQLSRTEGLRLSDATPRIQDPEKEGYEFTTWDPQVTETVLAQDANADSEIYYYAVWTRIEIPVHYPDADKEPDDDGKPQETVDDVPHGTTIIVDPNGGTWMGSPDIQTFTVVEEFYELTTYPEREGYRFTGWKKTANEDGTVLTFTAQWQSLDEVKSEYRLKINYVYTDGTKAAPTYFVILEEGTPYSIPSPQIEGYTASQVVVEGIKEAREEQYTVFYVKDTPQPIPDDDVQPAPAPTPTPDDNNDGVQPEAQRPAAPVNPIIIINDIPTQFGIGNVFITMGECAE